MIHVRGVGGKWEHSSTRCLHILLRAARCAALTYGMPIGRRVNSRPYTSMHISAGPGVMKAARMGGHVAKAHGCTEQPLILNAYHSIRSGLPRIQ